MYVVQALSILFLTVLSFDSITLGYAKSQNLTETSIAVFQGIGSITGILGTFAFEIVRVQTKLQI
jgi:iron-regulated transporter 1